MLDSLSRISQKNQRENKSKFTALSETETNFFRAVQRWSVLLKLDFLLNFNRKKHEKKKVEPSISIYEFSFVTFSSLFHACKTRNLIQLTHFNAVESMFRPPRNELRCYSLILSQVSFVLETFSICSSIWYPSLNKSFSFSFFSFSS